MTPTALSYMRLFKRVKRWKALPQAGGILDQEDKIMERLDIIADMVDDHDRVEKEMASQRAKNAELLRQAGPGAQVIGWRRKP